MSPVPFAPIHPSGKRRSTRTRTLQRALVALVCTQMLLGCTANAGTTLWPEPKPPVVPVAPPVSVWPQPAQVVQVAPNFQAPSATSCARPIVTREVPGQAGNVGYATPKDRFELARREAEKKSEYATKERSRRDDRPYVEESAGTSGYAMANKPTASVAASPAPALVAPSGAAPARAAGSMADSRTREPLAQAMPTPPQNSFAPPMQRPRPVVTAGMVDDNANFSEYMAFRARTNVAHRDRDVSERYLLQVRDSRGRSLPDAEVAVRAPTGYTMWARTDTAGRVWLHPNAFDPSGSRFYEVEVRKNGQAARAFLQRGQKSAVDVAMPGASAAVARAQLDLVFLIDATGSMADEIDKLKGSLRSIADEVGRLPSHPDLCFGMVAYRDKGDQFLIRSHDFTNDLNAFQRVLNNLRADGGGDYPEAMNEAFNEVVHNLSWRGNGTTRLVVLLADAPPHLDYGGPQYDDDMIAALGKGIKVYSVGASGLDPQGEYIQRQIAQYTGGRFVFLTYAEATKPQSGPGRETVHDVSNYSVDTLDRLVVRLVKEELEKLAL